ncbi:hypothetical protein A1O3_05600 [Capronia epimyces CBS 606.96]|uniref:Uncharacterized protein n=1 Tax=Capronia epimyces CBS 606.96 TaxID=1182542 RepID=W9Y5N2_9EURO|nr:uncharacterized protein A1O3_05600 [Capronia epimyces CBS 606.96]EXJ84925.1 hypothetical protein A1O3_05600 [Capronia epimyces CBS 606.96]
MHRSLHLLLLLALVYLAAAMPVANPGPIIEPNTLYVRQDTDHVLVARDPAEDLDLAKRAPILGWTWFNGGKKTKRSPILGWTWFNSGKKIKRSPILGWTWFNSGRKE